MRFSQMIKSELENWDIIMKHHFVNLEETPPNTSFLTQIRTNNEMIPMIPPLQMSDNWQKCFLNVLSNNVACTKENGNAMDMFGRWKKKKRWICWGRGKARNPKIQCWPQPGRVLSQDLGFQIIMKIKKKLTVEQKRMRKRERQPLYKHIG